MKRLFVCATAALVLLTNPTLADNSGGSEWLSKAFGGSSIASGSRVAGGKSASRSKAVSYSGGGGGGETGVASYYWQPQALASGGRFNPNAMTAAHKTLPFGTRVRVTALGSGRSVEVVINDRGPFIKGRIIDLSRRAAQDLGMTGAGVAQVSVQRL